MRNCGHHVGFRFVKKKKNESTLCGEVLLERSLVAEDKPPLSTRVCWYIVAAAGRAGPGGGPVTFERCFDVVSNVPRPRVFRS